MRNTDYEVISPGFVLNSDPNFLYAPLDWNQKEAIKVAQSMNIEMDEERWEIVQAIQEYYARHDKIRVRELLDALGEKFHYKGGTRFLLRKFPGGPLNQGCRIGGVSAPTGSLDLAYGTVR